MRADSALRHLHDGERCVARTQDGEREVIWSRRDWHFYVLRGDASEACDFDEILEWRPASIRFVP